MGRSYNCRLASDMTAQGLRRARSESALAADRCHALEAATLAGREMTQWFQQAGSPRGAGLQVLSVRRTVLRRRQIDGARPAPAPPPAPEPIESLFQPCVSSLTPVLNARVLSVYKEAKRRQTK
jgi:hypothetical protein